MQDQLVNLESDVAAHPRADDVARVVVTVATTAADERRARFTDGLDELTAEVELDAEAARIAGVDPLDILRSNTPDAKGRQVIALLLARGVAGALSDDTAADRWAGRLCWLAANTWLDATWSLAAGLDDEGERRWSAALGRLVRGEQERGLSSGRALAVVAAAALTASPRPAASAERNALASEIDDPTMAALLRASVRSDADDAASTPTPTSRPEDAAEISEVVGELVPAPLGALGLVLQGVTGILLLRYVGRLLARLLGCKRPATVTVARDRITVTTELTIVGKSLRKREHVIPVSALAQAVREVRYPGLPLYAGLIALALGTYFGASLATDGVRVGSPSLLGVGAAIIGLGVVVDLVFARLVPAGKGTHHVIFVPRRGRKIALAVADVDAADRALRSLRP